MEGPIIAKVGHYDENAKCFDEPGSPVKCRKLFDNYLEEIKRDFLNERKMYSFYTQCKVIADLSDVKKVLEIGPGGGTTATLMKRIGYDYQTMDTQPIVNPDILCDFLEFNPDGYEKSFDLVAAFQMLEHMPYDHFAPLIQKMATISRKWIFISLPYYCWTFRVEIEFPIPKLPFLETLLRKRFRRRSLGKRVALSIHRPYQNAPNRKYREQFMQEFPLAVHHWEIGRGAVTEKRVITDLENLGLSVKKTFHCKVFPYWYFILCEKIV